LMAADQVFRGAGRLGLVITHECCLCRMRRNASPSPDARTGRPYPSNSGINLPPPAIFIGRPFFEV
jgi:hypothetical protein